MSAVPSPREQLALASPPDALDAFSTFPQVAALPSRLFRVVRRGRGPWWFSGTLEGRFDLPAPAGTCYLACDAVAALFEVLGPGRTIGWVTEEFLAARQLVHLSLPGEPRLADLTAREAAEFGVTLEIATAVPYTLPQAWARRLAEAGFGGLLTFLRHDPAGSRGIALFGRAGEWTDGPVVANEPLRELARRAGLRVAPVPVFSELEIVDGGRLPQRLRRKRS